MCSRHCVGHDQTDADLYLAAPRPVIDAFNALIYPQINNGAYRSGFVKSQEDYKRAVPGVFVCLDTVDLFLTWKRFLTGHKLTEAEVRLYTTLMYTTLILV